jgi:hypothetical protein
VNEKQTINPGTKVSNSIVIASRYLQKRSLAYDAKLLRL